MANQTHARARDNLNALLVSIDAADKQLFFVQTILNNMSSFSQHYQVLPLPPDLVKSILSSCLQAGVDVDKNLEQHCSQITIHYNQKRSHDETVSLFRAEATKLSADVFPGDVRDVAPAEAAGSSSAFSSLTDDNQNLHTPLTHGHVLPAQNADLSGMDAAVEDVNDSDSGTENVGLHISSST